MEQLLAMTGRNLKLYFRDRGAVFFSLLSMIIVIVLMLFFLGDMSVEGLENLLSSFPGRDMKTDSENAELMILMWTCAGILSINAVTVTLATYSVMIKDRVSGKLSSIYTSPVPRSLIAVSYVASAWIASVVVCGITLLITELYCISQGFEGFDLVTHVKLLGMIMMNSFVYAALMYVLALIAKTEGSWSGIGTVIGTLVGFLGGIYIPIGSLSEVIGDLMKCMPVIYGTSMFRKVMLEQHMEKTFDGLPSEVGDEFCELMGITLKMGKSTLGFEQECFILCVCGILFLAVGIIMLKYSKKTDR